MTTDEFVKHFLASKKDGKLPPDHKPTDGERNNLCYLSMKYIARWPMRVCDFQIIELAKGDVSTVASLDTGYVPELAHFIWDHLMGEPDEPSIEDVTRMVLAVKEMLFSLDELSRNSI